MKYIPTILAIAASTAGLHAQSATEALSSTEPEAIALPSTVVTGTLWESELERTTASVTVIDQARLATNGTQHFEDIVNAIPNLTWTGGSSRPRYIQIRGIGENSQFEGETPDSAVRFLIDDLDLTGLGTVGNLFDVQQVEVLRGPQAGAFGANAAGGVVRIVTNDPTPYWTGQVEGTVGEDSLVAGGLAVGGPIIESDPEKLTFRLALHQLNQDGFRHNKHLGKDNTNERDELTTRFKLRWLANDDWQWDGTLLYANADNGYDEWSLNNTRFDTYSDEPGRDEQETLAGAIRGTWTGLADIDVTTITNYSTTDSTYSYDNDWVSGDYDSIPSGTYDGFIKNDRDHDTFGQELRFDSVEQSDALGWIDRWTVGTYFNHLEEDTTTQYSDYGGTADADYEYETNSYSAFGQIAHDFSTETRLIIGLRYEYYEVDMNTKSVEDSGDWYDGALSDEDSDQSSSLWGGKITLEHDLTAEQMVFASIARGYKAAGANGGVFRYPDDPLDFDDETLYNFEAGLRSEWFDAAVISQITAFYLYRDDPQLRDSEGSGGFFRYFTDNGDSAEHYGLEAEATWYISKGWTASAGLGLLETKDDDNDDLANAPTYTFNAQISYQAENGFFANLAAQGSDEYYESNNKENRDQRVRNSFVTFNGSIGYQYENWTFTVWGKNLFDEEYEKRVFYFDNYDGQGDTRFENPAHPQQFGITANYRW
jgi:iron complex outermembrane receptor protein